MQSIQLELSDADGADILVLAEQLGLMKPQDVLYESIDFFRRIIAEVKLGRMIMSIPTENGRIVASVDEHNQIMTTLGSQSMLDSLAAKYA